MARVVRSCLLVVLATRLAHRGLVQRSESLGLSATAFLKIFSRIIPLRRVERCASAAGCSVAIAKSQSFLGNAIKPPYLREGRSPATVAWSNRTGRHRRRCRKRRPGNRAVANERPSGSCQSGHNYNCAIGKFRQGRLSSRIAFPSSLVWVDAHGLATE